MSKATEVIYDTWTALTHKRDLPETTTGRPRLAPTWVGDQHRRRLTAYTILRRYLDNVARESLTPETGIFRTVVEQAHKETREYGDPRVFVARIVDSVIGEDVAIVLPDAANDPPDEPDLPPPPDEPTDEDPDITRRIFAVRQARFDVAVEEVFANWEDQLAAHDVAVERQRWLEQWADSEQMLQQMFEAEPDAVGLGDGVYVLGVSQTKRRPTSWVCDPGFYFPVLDDSTNKAFPDKVHIAWEYERPTETGESETVVRRITWELIETGEARRYPWHGPDDLPSTKTCVMTDAWWPLNSLGKRDVEDFSDTNANFMLNEDGVEVRDLDLFIDFVPVVHLPDTPARKEHFGVSVISHAAQLFDDIQAADTDLASASRKAGGPVLGLKDGVLDKDQVITYGPGTVLQGEFTVLDMAAGMDSLMAYLTSLLERASVNMQTPNEILGRVDSASNIAGIAIRLRFGPHEGLVRKLRLVREEKYQLYLKFVQRLAQSAGFLPPGPTPAAKVVFGSFVPTDVLGIVTMVVNAFVAKVISRQTALEMLVEAGFPIDNVQAELDRIEAEDFLAADMLFTATGDEQAVRDRLGLKGPGPRPVQGRAPQLQLNAPNRPAQQQPPNG